MDTNRDIRKTTIKTGSSQLPSWYGDSHRSTWDRVKEALKRDWEQTKNDFSAEAGRDLNQNVGDTLKQATGSDPLPLPSQKTHPDAQTAWTDAEPALRYGYASRSQYADHVAWDDGLERKLESEWNTLETGRKWDEVKGSVRRGWDSVKKS